MKQTFVVSPAIPPVAPRIPHPTTLHGTNLPDDYAWLRDKSSPDVIA
jgi:oligopeptidase B